MAVAAGLPVSALRGARFREIVRGVHICADVEPTLSLWLEGALLKLPEDAIVSHVSALWLLGIEIGRPYPLQFSTNRPLTTTHDAIALHRRQGRMRVDRSKELPVTEVARTLIDCATQLSFVQFVQAADMMIDHRLVTWAELMEFAWQSHLNGVYRARRFLPYAREGAESPMETLVRLMIVFARLPEPECNRNIIDGRGAFLARGDLVFAAFRVVVEYDGWHHERSAKQRQRDIERRESLEAEGWRVIVITVADFSHPHLIPLRVYEALAAKGYPGPRPQTNATWTRWFAHSKVSAQNFVDFVTV